jgi:hypothetical protein
MKRKVKMQRSLTNLEEFDSIKGIESVAKKEVKPDKRRFSRVLSLTREATNSAKKILF